MCYNRNSKTATENIFVFPCALPHSTLCKKELGLKKTLSFDGTNDTGNVKGCSMFLQPAAVNLQMEKVCGLWLSSQILTLSFTTGVTLDTSLRYSAQKWPIKLTLHFARIAPTTL